MADYPAWICADCGESDYPVWICPDCGEKHGRRPSDWRYVTWHAGDRCGWCDEPTITTEPRDYGYPREPKEVKHG